MAKKPMRQPQVIPSYFDGNYPQFTESDLQILEYETELPLKPDADRAALAGALERASSFLIAEIRGGVARPPKERADWARELQRRADDLLAMFETEDPLVDRARNARWLLQDLPIAAMSDAELPLDMAERLADAWEILPVLSQRAKIAAEFFETTRRARRQPRLAELDFFAALRLVFREAFGQEWAPATNRNTGGREGSSARFCMAVVRLIRERLAEEKRPGDPLHSTLRRLAQPGPATDRIRDTLSGGLVRKR